MARNIEFDEDAAIQKAMEVFWKKGYNATSMRDLTDAMQINSSSLYNTIGDKRQLFVKCIRNYTQRRMQNARQHSAGVKSPLKAIINFINNSVNTILYEKNSCLAIKITFELAATDLEVQAILKEDNDFTHGFLLSLVQRAIEKKEMDASTDEEMITDYILNCFTGWYESYILNKDEARIKKMAKYLITQISG
jgi:TetR/AcrR family transcriptional repressor of nem operon